MLNNGLPVRVIVLSGIFHWMILFFVIHGDFEQVNLLQVSPNSVFGQKHTTIVVMICFKISNKSFIPSK